MSQQFPQLDQIRVAVDEGTRKRHLSVIVAGLQRSPRRRRRTRLMAVAVAVILLLPVLAAASGNSLPGDVLYPLKRALEPIVSVFDGAAEAENRVREVEALLERDAPRELVREHLVRARKVVTEDQPHLSGRLDEAERFLRPQEPDGGDVSGDDSGPEPEVDQQPTREERSGSDQDPETESETNERELPAEEDDDASLDEPEEESQHRDG